MYAASRISLVVVLVVVVFCFEYTVVVLGVVRFSIWLPRTYSFSHSLCIQFGSFQCLQTEASVPKNKMIIMFLRVFPLKKIRPPQMKLTKISQGLSEHAAVLVQAVVL